MVGGGVELGAIGGEPAGVVDLIEFERLGFRAGTDLEVLVFEAEGGFEDAAADWNSWRKLDAGGRGFRARAGFGRGSGLGSAGGGASGAGVGAVCATATVAARAISRAECLAKFIDVLETPK